MLIREAIISDFADVTDLLEQAGRPRVTDQTYAACRQLYADHLQHPNAAHFVAEDERGNVVGFCALRVRERLNTTAPEAWVPELIVTPAARGRGTARALLEHAEEIGRSRGCDTVMVETGYDHREAHLLYTAAGMEDAGKMFRKAL